MTGAETQLFEACAKGDLAQITRLTKKSLFSKPAADVDARDAYGVTPLVRAAAAGHLEAAKALIDNRADVNALLPDGDSTLHRIVGFGNLALVEVLIERGADVNAKNKSGATPLCHALAHRPSPDPRIAALLAKVADPTMPDGEGHSPLVLALKTASEMREPAERRPYIDVAKALLARRVEVNRAGKDGLAPLFWALLLEDAEIVASLRALNAKLDAKGSVALPDADSAVLESALKAMAYHPLKQQIVQLMYSRPEEQLRAAAIDATRLGYEDPAAVNSRKLTALARFVTEDPSPAVAARAFAKLIEELIGVYAMRRRLDLPPDACRAIASGLRALSDDAARAEAGFSRRFSRFPEDVCRQLQGSEGAEIFIAAVASFALDRRLPSSDRNEATIVLKKMQDRRCLETLLALASDGDAYVAANAKAGLSVLPAEPSEGSPPSSSDAPGTIVLRELKAAAEVVRRARSGGMSGTVEPLRPDAIDILAFTSDQEEQYRRHASLLAFLGQRGLLKEIRAYKLDIRGQNGLTGLLILLSSAPTMQWYVKNAYYLPEAEAFIAENCAGNWAAIEPRGRGATDTPWIGNALNLSGAEESLAAMLSIVSASERAVTTLF